MPSESRLTAPTIAVLQALLGFPTAGASGLDLGITTSLRPGSLHPTLARLEHRQWVESYWEEADPSDLGRPRRRLYRLNPVGATMARQALREAQRAQAAWRLTWRPAAGAT